MKSARLLRRLVLGKDILIMPVVHDALCAKIAHTSEGTEKFPLVVTAR